MILAIYPYWKVAWWRVSTKTGWNYARLNRLFRRFLHGQGLIIKLISRYKFRPIRQPKPGIKRKCWVFKP